MITIRKLNSLKPGTRQRKIVSLLKMFETADTKNNSPDRRYLSLLAESAGDLENLSEKERQRVRVLAERLNNHDVPVMRFCNTLRHLLLRNMHAEPVEWDLVAPGDGRDEKEERVVLPFYIYLDDVRSPFNVGSIFRTAESFGVKKIYLSEDTASPDHPRAQRTARGCTERIPWEVLTENAFPELPVFALELGGTPLQEFLFPSSGILVVGSEELGVNPRLLARADNSLGRVSISTGGLKGSINVSVAFGIVQHSWYSRIIGE